MTQIILPKKRKIDETENIALPYVKCDACGNMATSGLKQTQLRLVRKSYRKKINGQWVLIPPVMKRVELYMCNDCVARGRKWPGDNPR